MREPASLLRSPYREAVLRLPQARRIPAALGLLLRLGGRSAQLGWLMLASGLIVLNCLVARSRVASSETGRWLVPSAPDVLCVLLLPVAGALLACREWLRGRRRERLLRTGSLARATLVSTAVSYEFTGRGFRSRLPYQFQSRDGERHTFTVTVDEPRSIAEWHSRPLVHDPGDVTRTQLLGDLPGTPRVDSEDRLRTTSIPGVALRLALPICAIAAQAVLLARLLRLPG